MTTPTLSLLELSRVLTELKEGLDDAATVARVEAVIAAERSKEQAKPQQEPVAWSYQEYARLFYDHQWHDEVSFVQPPNNPEQFRNIVPLYTSPQPLSGALIVHKGCKAHWHDGVIEVHPDPQP